MNRIIVNNDNHLVELGDNKFKKQVLRFGEWNHGGARNGKLVITKEKAEKMLNNFKSRVIENIPVLRGHHTQLEAESNPELIAGYVEDLEVTDDGLYAVLNLEDDATKELETKFRNVSAAIDEGYEDHESGSLMGAVIRHIALVTEPYIKKLDPNFVALSEGDTLIVNQNTMSDKDNVKLEEETTEVVEETTEETPDQVEETTEEVVEEEITEDPETTENTEATEEVVEEVVTEEVELSELEIKLKELEKENAELKKKEIENEFQTLLSEGKVIPAVKDEVLGILSVNETVYLSEEKTESTANLFRSFLQKLPNIVELGETGSKNGEKDVELTEKEQASLRGASEKAIEAYKKDKSRRS